MSTRDAIEVAPAPHRRMHRLDYDFERGEHVFRAARSRSRLVRFLKVVLPAIAGAGIFVFALTVFMFKSEIEGISMADIDLEAGSLIMEAPRVSGFDETKKSYDIKADRAIQSLENPKQVRLEGIGARLGLDSENSAMLEATAGLYDTAAETLVLSDGVVITMSNGLKATLTRADIDLQKGSMVTTDPVSLESAEGSISANEVEISDQGRLIRFRRGVKVTLVPDGAFPAKAEAGGSQPMEATSSAQ